MALSEPVSHLAGSLAGANNIFDRRGFAVEPWAAGRGDKENRSIFDTVEAFLNAAERTLFEGMAVTTGTNRISVIQGSPKISDILSHDGNYAAPFPFGPSAKT